MKTTFTIEAFVNDRLIDSDRFISPKAVYPCSAVVYHTRLVNSFVQTVIDGTSRAASFPAKTVGYPYQQLLTSIKALSGNELSFVFYGRDPDNALSVMSWVRPCTYEHACHSLDTFETAPAEEGGVSWLGFIGESTTWLLLHVLEPSESFNITAYGTAKFCRELTTSLGIDHVPAGDAV